MEMKGSTTYLKNPDSKDDAKDFAYDHSYWSHDGCKDDGTGYFGPDTKHPNGKKFADQVSELRYILYMLHLLLHYYRNIVQELYKEAI